jgi:plasmanylethanolamine desaturase
MSPYPLWFRVLEHIGTGASLLLGIALALSLWRGLSGPHDACIAFGAGGLGYLAADFVTGLVHWAGDRLGSPHTPVFGPSVIAPFREHHADPLDLTRRSFMELCGSSFILVAPAFGTAWFVASAIDGVASLILQSFMLSLGVWTGITNQLHCWAHALARPPAIAWLQRSRLILAPERHALHHAPPFEGHYCVTTGWCNPLLARLRFFERLEKVLGVRGV